METSQVLFSLETLIITVSAGAVAALVVGFVTGFCCGRRCHKDDNTLAGHLGYPDTEYEYFEQRGGLARPTLLSSGPPLPPGLPPGPGGGGPLLPQETAKLDSRHEEVNYLYFLFGYKDNNSLISQVTYAEPELVTGLAGYSGGPLMGSGGPVGPGVIGMSGPLPNSRYVGIGSSGLMGQGSHYSSSLLNNPVASKFNTIHSSVNKQRNNPLSNHYESAVNRNIGGNGSYHLSTLSRSSSVRGGNGGNGTPGSNSGGARDPLLPSSGSSSAGSGSAVQKMPQTAKVVDSAYGTTRSSKKVYL